MTNPCEGFIREPERDGLRGHLSGRARPNRGGVAKPIARTLRLPALHRISLPAGLNISPSSIPDPPHLPRVMIAGWAKVTVRIYSLRGSVKADGASCDKDNSDLTSAEPRSSLPVARMLYERKLGYIVGPNISRWEIDVQIYSVSISNLRSIASLELSLEKVTAILGSNNAGKSTVLRALQLFFDASPKIEADDFYKRSAERIDITITFHNLTHHEIDEFGTAVRDGKLQVSRHFNKAKNSDHSSYSVVAPAYPAFVGIRMITSKMERRKAYAELCTKMGGMTKATSADDVDQKMAEWESANPDKLEFQQVRGFFGATNVAIGKLKKKTSLHYIPAVADANEETSDPKKSPIIVLLADIAKQIYENREEVQQFLIKTNDEFNELVSPEKFPQLSQISDELTKTVQRYYSNSKLIANWEAQEGIRATFPQPSIRVEDNGFLSGLQHVGHGLQRASLFAVIEFLATRGAETSEEQFDKPQSDIIILVEEPEIYQHPTKQQVINDAFHGICKTFSRATGIRFQIVFATHSEKFIGISKFHSARILRKHEEDGRSFHHASAINIEECSEYFGKLTQRIPMSPEAFEAKMHIFSRELCEGFFASKVVLVEGVSDKAILEGAYQAQGRNPASEGIAILSVDGKTKMDKPLHIFRTLKIPTYAVFDSDASKQKPKQRTKANILLQKILDVENPIELPHGITPKFACFDEDIETYLKRVCGQLWEKEFISIADEYGLQPEDISKTPMVVSKICDRGRELGLDFSRFNQIIEHVDALQS